MVQISNRRWADRYILYFRQKVSKLDADFRQEVDS
jgi:hypothetical protein